MRAVKVFILICLLSTPGYSQILPAPAELAATPDCAYAYLYSIDQLHYYSTIDCANPLLTGFGVSGGTVITNLGCNGSSCKEGAIVTPSKLPAESFYSPSAKLSACFCAKANRFAISKGSKGQVLLVEKRVKEVKDDPGDPRKNVAMALLQPVAGKSLLARAAEQMEDSSSTELEKLQAKVLLERAARYMNRAQVKTQQASSSNQGANLTLHDDDFGIGVFNNLDGTTERDIDVIFNQGETGWTAADAMVYEFNKTTAKKYVEYSNKDVKAFFRLQQITKGDVVHYIGQQVLEDDLPGTTNPYVKATAQNVKIIQTQDHVHVLQVRTNPNGTLEDNSREFLVYSGEELGSRK